MMNRALSTLVVAASSFGAPARAAAPDDAASTPDLESKGLTQPATVKDGQYADKDGNPTDHVSQDGKTVDWYTMSGYLRYNSACIVCHGPDGVGSTYAPALVDALTTMDYAHFAGIVVGGKRDVNSAERLVMPCEREPKVRSAATAPRRTSPSRTPT